MVASEATRVKIQVSAIEQEHSSPKPERCCPPAVGIAG